MLGWLVVFSNNWLFQITLHPIQMPGPIPASVTTLSTWSPIIVEQAKDQAPEVRVANYWVD